MSSFTDSAGPGRCSDPGRGAKPSRLGPGGSAGGCTAALGGSLYCLLYLGWKSAGGRCRCQTIGCCLQKRSQLSFEPPQE